VGVCPAQKRRLGFIIKEEEEEEERRRREEEEEEDPPPPPPPLLLLHTPTSVIVEGLPYTPFLPITLHHPSSSSSHP